jgi:hypothetical protein
MTWGGTKTMGGVMGYYHGVKDNVFFKKQNDEAERLALEAGMNKKIGRQIYHLRSVLDKGGQFISSAILCQAITRDNTVKGVVICRNGQLELVLADITIDATGDGDVAAMAGRELPDRRFQDRVYTKLQPVGYRRLRQTPLGDQPGL